MLEKFRKQKNNKPVDKEALENMIKLLEIVRDIESDFRLSLVLKSGNFILDKKNFLDIKMINTKKEPVKILIKHQNTLLSSDTYIDIDNIVKFELLIDYYKSGDDDV